jgi:hypothetical protein
MFEPTFFLGAPNPKYAPLGSTASGQIWVYYQLSGSNVWYSTEIAKLTMKEI